ncbi:hypothetical protein H696_02827 [Fonticula alba]|uniref:Transcription initiation factor IIF subunit beta n=1 Tax=Fonticula alba TaxID=691883 RepID=A0A058Z8U1_FONAL|nr:hypothetical protein H696_02827 [Fonticula alba]KCV70486.1 hypothetical protein H696_02827 [Fonticula alba]|eukprot:XP_009495002.1 hypothetical protein H696_02827 [Fonticula alba]
MDSSSPNMDSSPPVLSQRAADASMAAINLTNAMVAAGATNAKTEVKEGTLDLDASQEVFLVKVPDYIYKLWSRTPRGTRLGKVRATKGLFDKNPSSALRTLRAPVIHMELEQVPDSVLEPPRTLSLAPYVRNPSALPILEPNLPVLPPPKHFQLRPIGTYRPNSHFVISEGSLESGGKVSLAASVGARMSMQPEMRDEYLSFKQALHNEEHREKIRKREEMLRLRSLQDEAINVANAEIKRDTAKETRVAPAPIASTGGGELITDLDLRNLLLALLDQKEYVHPREGINYVAEQRNTAVGESRMKKMLGEIGERIQHGEHKHKYRLMKAYRRP